VAGLGHDYLTGIAKINERLLILLDITKILDFETNEVAAVIEQFA
jgi:chemotaxis signal transduction protein